MSVCQIIYVKFKFSILDASFSRESCTVFLKFYSVITLKATYVNYGIRGLNRRLYLASQFWSILAHCNLRWWTMSALQWMEGETSALLCIFSSFSNM